MTSEAMKNFGKAALPQLAGQIPGPVGDLAKMGTGMYLGQPEVGMSKNIGGLFGMLPGMGNLKAPGRFPAPWSPGIPPAMPMPGGQGLPPWMRTPQRPPMTAPVPQLTPHPQLNDLQPSPVPQLNNLQPLEQPLPPLNNNYQPGPNQRLMNWGTVPKKAQPMAPGSRWNTSIY